MGDDFEISNLGTTEGFGDAFTGTGLNQMASQSKVHIRLQQRNRRKCILTVTGLAEDLDLKKIARALKKNLKCNGAVVNDNEYGDIIQLQGDHRQKVQEFLVEQEIVEKEQIVVHGH